MLVCVFPLCLLHARPRVQRAPGFPCALLLFEGVHIDAKLGRIAPRECGRTSTRCMTIELEIHTHVISGKRLVRRSSQRRRKRDPSIGIHGVDGFREGLNPSYELQGFGGSLGWNAALPVASPPPELWVASSSQSCRIRYSSSGVLFSSGAGWVERSDTHQLLLVGRWVSQRAQPILRAIAACAALLRGGIWLDSRLPSLHSAALMRAACSGFRKPS